MTSTPLPSARPSVFTTYGGASEPRNSTRRLLVGERAVARGRHRRRREQLLHPRLGALQPRAVGIGAEREDAAGADGFGDAVHQLAVGPTTTTSTARSSASCRDRGRVERVDGEAQRGLARSPRCPARRTPRSRPPTAAAPTPARAPPPVPDDQKSHASLAAGLSAAPRGISDARSLGATVWRGRRRRMNDTGTPAQFSTKRT